MPVTRRTAIPMPPVPIRPDPDPTVLTTQGLIRESDHSRDLTDAVVEGIKSALLARLDGMDKAIVLLRSETDKVPAEIEQAVREQEKVNNVRFQSVQNQLQERDTRTDQTRGDAKLALDVALQGQVKAVDAAFVAQKQASDKMEASFTKLIDQIALTATVQDKSTADKIDDIKTRLAAVESAPKLTDTSLDDVRSRMQSIDSRLSAIDGQKKGSSEALGLIVAIGGIVVAALALFLKH